MSSIILVCEIELVKHNGVALVTENEFFSSHPYNPPPGPSPRDPAVIEPFFNPVIFGDPKAEFKMGCYVWGYDSISTEGDIDFLNVNSKLNYLLKSPSKGKKVWYYLGKDDEPFVNFTQVAELVQNKFIQSSEKLIRLTFSDEMQKLDRAVQQLVFPSYDLPSSYNPSNFKKPMPKFYGKCKSIPLTLNRKVNEEYQISDVPLIHSYQGVYDNGIEKTLGVGPAQYQIGTTSDTSKAAIHFNGNTFGVITADARSSNVFKTSQVLKGIMQASFGLTLEPVSLLQFDLRNNYNVGVYLSNEVSGVNVMKGILNTYNGWMYQTPKGEIKFGSPRDPIGYPDIFVDKNNAMGNFITLSDDAPNLSDTIGFQKNWYVFTKEALAAGVPSVLAERLTKPFRRYRHAKSSVHSHYSHATRACPIPSIIINQSNAQKAIDKITAFYGGRRWFYEVDILLNEIHAALLEPDAVVALSIKDFNLIDPYDIDEHGYPLATSGWLVDHQSRLSSYSAGQDPTPEKMRVEDNMSTLTLYGNSWKAFEYSYLVTEDTLLEFDFKAVGEAEILGVGVSTSSSAIPAATQNMFQVFGTQNVFDQTHHNYVDGSGWKRYIISVGQIAVPGQRNYLIIMADNDANAVHESSFRNVRLREKGFLHTQLIGGRKSFGSKKIKILTWGG